MLHLRLSRRNIKLLVFVFAYFLIVWRIFFVPLYNSEGGRNFIRGDEYSEKNTHSALRYFYEYGFSGTKWLPVFNYDDFKKGAKLDVYTHYPALPDILAGVYAKVLNTTEPQWIRLFPLLISVGWFFLIFQMLKSMLPDKKAAFLSACILVLSNYFLAWADNLHKHMYEELLKWLFVYGLFLYYENGRKNKWLLAGLALVYIIAANISMEPILFLAVVVIGFSVIYTRRLFTPETIALGLASVVGFGLHFWQNILYFGSFQAALNDMTNAAVMRTVGNADKTNELQRTLGITDFLQIPFKWLNRLERYFLIPGWALLVLGYLGMRKMKAENIRTFQVAIVLLIAGIIWSLAMSQHFMVHIFTTRNIGLFYGCIVGYGVVAYLPLVKKAWLEKNRLQQTFHVLFIGYIFVMAASQQIWDIYIKYGFGYPWLVK
jgi:hypothetical protein